MLVGGIASGPSELNAQQVDWVLRQAIILNALAGEMQRIRKAAK